MSEVFTDRRAAHQWLQGQGWVLAYSTFCYHISKRKLLKVGKDGSITRKKLERYAKAHLVRDGEPPREKDDAGGGAQEKRAEAQAESYEADAELKRLRVAKLKGRIVEKATVADELAVRARAFRLGLEGWGPKAAAAIAEMFGAGEAAALRIIEAAGGDMERLEAVQALAESLLPDLVELWSQEVERFLAPYADGTWWTEEMAAAMAVEGPREEAE